MAAHSTRCRSQDDAKRRAKRLQCRPVGNGPVPRIQRHARGGPGGPRMEPERQRYPCMREVVFRVLAERPGHLEAQAESLPIHIAAPTLEDLQHEAREALIDHVGPAHCTYRVRIRRNQSQPVSAIRPLRRPPALCG